MLYNVFFSISLSVDTENVTQFMKVSKNSYYTCGVKTEVTFQDRKTSSTDSIDQGLSVSHDWCGRGVKSVVLLTTSRGRRSNG